MRIKPIWPSTPAGGGNLVPYLAIGLLLVVGNNVARAGFSVTLFVDGGQLPTIVDNMAGDINPDPFDMTVPFTVGDVGNNWSASGTIYANGGGGVPPVSTIITDTLIEKFTPGLHFGEIRVVHDYAASGVFSHTGELDGQFENVLNNLIGGAELNYIANVQGQNLGVFHDGPVSGVFVHPFQDSFGPLVLPTTTEHEIILQFYLDEPGDAIRLFDSAEIHSVPEPSALLLGAMALMCIALFPGRRRRDRAHATRGRQRKCLSSLRRDTWSVRISMIGSKHGSFCRRAMTVSMN